MKLHYSLLLFFVFFYFTECMVRTVHYRNQRVDGKIANYSYFITRGRNQIKELTKQLRKNFNDTIGEGKEAIFGDVIKNITRVNNVLEELIKNYEKLKHIYKSQETFEQDVKEESSDMEIDEKYKQRKLRAKDSKDVVVTRNPNALATDMFLEEREEPQNAPKVNKEDHKKSGNMAHEKQDKRVPMIQFLRQPTKEKTKSVTFARDPLVEDNDNISSDTSSEYTESGTKDNKIQELSKRSKQNKPALDPQIPKLFTQEKIVTEENILDSSKNTSPLTQPIVKSEQYTSHFWDSNKSPVHLRAGKEIMYGKGSIRHNIHKVVSPIFNNDENDETRASKAPLKYKSIHINAGTTAEKGAVKVSNHTFPTQMREPNLLTDSIEWSVEDDKTIEKEQFKTSILRKAYGDACLKVVVKKCYKACKQVTKTGCVKYDCKPSFINEFKDHAKTGCIAEFRDETVIHKQNRAKSSDKMDDNDFVDITRSGYLASACLPSKIRHKPMPIVQRTTGNVTISPQGYQLNILRDRFEMACQKASAEKCKRACYYATSQVCSVHDCKVGKKSNLARECRAHCKETYRYTGEDKSDDSDTDVDTGAMDESSSASENTYNDSRPDPDFEEYLNSTTTPSVPKNAKKSTKSATKAGLDSDSVMKVNMKLSRAFGYKKSFRPSKKHSS